MPTRRLPDSPNLDQLRAQAEDLRRDHAARSVMAAQRLREFHPRFRPLGDDAIFAASLSQSDALLAIAREYGYLSWLRLKKHVEGPRPVDRWQRPQHELITNPSFRRAVDLIDTGDSKGLQAFLQTHPGIIRQHITFEGGNYFHSPTLLNFVAENPVRHGKLTPKVLEVTRALLEADPDQQSKDETLMLVATGSVPRQSGVQAELISLLCAHGADPAIALEAVALHGEPGAVLALLHHGAALTLAAAAALNLESKFKRLLSVASGFERHIALSVAAQYGHVKIVALLLDAGEDPNRYNPPGGHSHATPLHQAVTFGHLPVVRLLLDRGALTDMEDVLWRGTPLGWAHHSDHKNKDIEALLLARQKPHSDA
jgi:hypothetical protein